MEVVKLGKKGQVSIPRKLMNELGLSGDSMLIVDKTEDGAILLRPAGVFPIEMYSDERIEAFLNEAGVPDELNERVQARLNALRAAKAG